jgi:hypothetical protein
MPDPFEPGSHQSKLAHGFLSALEQRQQKFQILEGG